MDKATIHMMNINMNKEENKQYIYHQPEVIETDSFKKWNIGYIRKQHRLIQRHDVERYIEHL